MRRKISNPFDIPNIELGRRGEECSFEATIKKYQEIDIYIDNVKVTKQNELWLEGEKIANLKD
jgi:hypothetical protein